MMQFYADTVKKMAHCHFVSGSPLRTLCLLIAGQPADVFSFENPVNSGLSSPQQPVEVILYYNAPYMLFWHQRGF
jgi:COPII coat assembly protein SEC16